MIKLREWLDANHTTQADLARKVGVSQPVVSDWLNGHMFPSIKNLRQLSKITNMSIDALLYVKPARGRSTNHSAV